VFSVRKHNLRLDLISALNWRHQCCTRTFMYDDRKMKSANNAARFYLTLSGVAT